MTPEEIEDRLKKARAIADHAFDDRDLLLEAITHRSYANESEGRIRYDNDRLEFLGDSALDLLVADMIFKRFPDLSSGQMTKLRASLVNEVELAQIAGELRLGESLFLGVGEARNGGGSKTSVLADAYEAFLGAVYMDGGLEAARGMVERDMSERIDAQSRRIGEQDPKSLLQEFCAKRQRSLPVYRTVRRSGPDHDVRFKVECVVDGRLVGVGEDRNIKSAEQRAARMALDELEGDVEGRR